MKHSIYSKFVTVKPLCGILYLAVILSISGTSCNAKRSLQNAANSNNASNPTIMLDTPVFKEIKKDKTTYSGSASNAEYYNDRHISTIINPKLDGTLKNGGSFTASSDRAFYYDNKQLITLKDNIYASLNNDYDIRCNTMDYLIDKRIIIAKEPITVTGTNLQLHADKGSIGLEDNRLTMQGNINAKIYNMSLK